MDPSPTKETPAENLSNLAALLDVQLPVSIRFGETEMLLEDVIKLGIGSVIELNTAVDDPVETHADGRGLPVETPAFHACSVVFDQKNAPRG